MKAWLRQVFLVMALALPVLAADTATIRVTNTGTSALVLDGGRSVAPGATASVEVPANTPGMIAGKGYPALRPGATYTLRVPGGKASAAGSGPKTVTWSPDRSTARGTAHPAKKTMDGDAVARSRFDLPVLWVMGNGKGGCSRQPFMMSRDPSSGESLVIGGGENVPGGQGDAIRASRWQAAVTAAMLRRDPLTGVRIVCEYSGYVDGPSAGGVICLAILSALDGRAFPEDFAMTGTIMADGTIGLVGGVARKLEGAAEAGIKRVCIPSFCRFEKQGDDGPVIDLHDHARRLGIELHPVSSIEEAYAVAHRLSMPISATPPHVGLYGETTRIDSILLDVAVSNASRGDSFRNRIVRALKNEEPLAALADNAMESVGRLPGLDTALDAGMLHVAMRLSAEQYAYLAGVDELYRRLEKDIDYDLDTEEGYGQWKRDLDLRVKRAIKQINAREAAWINEGGDGGQFSLAAAQCGLVNLGSELGNAIICIPLPEVSGQDIAAGEDSELLGRLLRREATLLWHENLSETLDGGWRRVAAAIPQCSPARSPATIENFFYAARVAQDKVIDDSFKEVARTLWNASDDWSLYDNKRNEANLYHAQAASMDSDSAPFAQVLSAMAQIDALAHGSMVSVMFGNEIGVSVDDGRIGYSNTPYLTYLLRTAREEAVRALLDCDSAGVPCPRVRAHLEAGDYYRDSDHYDRFEVLREYWCAMLKAKALHMIFAR